MPKIIENVREQLLSEARRQIAERGYANTTMRSVARECGLAVGTVYNYFSSKDMLIATFMAEEWKSCLDEISESVIDDPKALLLSVYNVISSFSKKHSALFLDPEAEKVFATVGTMRHRQLRSQLAAVILPICKKSCPENSAFAAEFIIESILTWTHDGVEFDEIYWILEKIIK